MNWSFICKSFYIRCIMNWSIVNNEARFTFTSFVSLISSLNKIVKKMNKIFAVLACSLAMTPYICFSDTPKVKYMEKLSILEVTADFQSLNAHPLNLLLWLDMWNSSTYMISNPWFIRLHWIIADSKYKRMCSLVAALGGWTLRIR